jgi:hypothetical protein
MELGNGPVALLLSEEGLVSALLANVAEVKPGLEVREAAENVWENKI